jgi:hypothetical protein
MEHTTQPPAFARWRGCGHGVLSKGAPNQEKYEKIKNCPALHERIKTDPKAFEVAKNLSNPLSNRDENSLCIRVLPGFRRR